MKKSEYYEKYFKIKNSEGALVSPPPLSEAEKEFIDNVYKYDFTGVKLMGCRKRTVGINFKALNNKFKMLPQFLKNVSTDL